MPSIEKIGRSNIDEIEKSKRVEIAPFMQLPLPIITNPNLSFERGSIEKASSIDSFTPSMPVLASPSNVETQPATKEQDRLQESEKEPVQIMNKFLQIYINGEKISQKQADHIMRNFESACAEIEKLSTDENEKWIELQEKGKTSAWWDTFSHVASTLRSAATFTLGASALSGGSPYIGAALLTSFAVGVTNEVMTQTQSWEKIAGLFTDTQKQNTAWGFETGAEILATLLAVPGAFTTTSNTLFNNLENIFSRVTSLASASAAIGSGKSKGDTLQAESIHLNKSETLGSKQQEIEKRTKELESLPDARSAATAVASSALDAHEKTIEAILQKS